MKKAILTLLIILGICLLVPFIFVKVFLDQIEIPVTEPEAVVEQQPAEVEEVKRVPQKVKCPDCGGEGCIQYEKVEKCPMCKGNKLVKSGMKGSDTMYPCPKCGGTGVKKKTAWKTCPKCGGKGYIERYSR